MILGIDTSNYTTSAAVMDKQGNLIAQERRLLEVEAGARGLRQSKAVFQHVEQLPKVIDSLTKSENWHQQKLTTVAVSTAPRPNEDSYMPVFRVGEGQARSLASLLSIPLVTTSHQEGHLMAGVWSTDLARDSFLAVQISGGTTELLLVTVNDEQSEFEIEVLGESQDLHAGQYIDRVGVELGLSFPAGPTLEKLAQQGDEEAVDIPSSVDGYQISFSGPCSAAMRAIERGVKDEDIALAVQRSIANSLEKVIRKAVAEIEIKEVLFVGGVSANQYIRKRLRNRLEHPAVGAKLYFPPPKWSSDNAVGTTAIPTMHKQLV